MNRRAGARRMTTKVRWTADELDGTCKPPFSQHALAGNEEWEVRQLMSKTDRISLSEHGMAKFLSGIELRVMEYMWSQSGTATSTEIAAAIGGGKLTTLAPLLDRLVGSGLLHRKLDEAGTRFRYLYSTCCGREAAQRALVDRVAEAMVDSFGHVAVAAFSKYVPRGEGRQHAEAADDRN